MTSVADLLPSSSSISVALSVLKGHRTDATINLDLSTYSPSEVQFRSETKACVSSPDLTPNPTPQRDLLPVSSKSTTDVVATPDAVAKKFTMPAGCSWADMMDSDSDDGFLDYPMPVTSTPENAPQATPTPLLTTKSTPAPQPVAQTMTVSQNPVCPPSSSHQTFQTTPTAQTTKTCLPVSPSTTANATPSNTHPSKVLSYADAIRPSPNTHFEFSPSSIHTPPFSRSNLCEDRPKETNSFSKKATANRPITNTPPIQPCEDVKRVVDTLTTRRCSPTITFAEILQHNLPPKQKPEGEHTLPRDCRHTTHISTDNDELIQIQHAEEIEQKIVDDEMEAAIDTEIKEVNTVITSIPQSVCPPHEDRSNWSWVERARGYRTSPTVILQQRPVITQPGVGVFEAEEDVVDDVDSHTVVIHPLDDEMDTARSDIPISDPSVETHDDPSVAVIESAAVFTAVASRQYCAATTVPFCWADKVRGLNVPLHTHAPIQCTKSTPSTTEEKTHSAVTVVETESECEITEEQVKVMVPTTTVPAALAVAVTDDEAQWSHQDVRTMRKGKQITKVSSGPSREEGKRKQSKEVSRKAVQSRATKKSAASSSHDTTVSKKELTQRQVVWKWAPWAPKVPQTQNKITCSEPTESTTSFEIISAPEQSSSSLSSCVSSAPSSVTKPTQESDQPAPIPDEATTSTLSNSEQVVPCSFVVVDTRSWAERVKGVASSLPVVGINELSASNTCSMSSSESSSLSVATVHPTLNDTDYSNAMPTRKRMPLVQPPVATQSSTALYPTPSTNDGISALWIGSLRVRHDEHWLLETFAPYEIIRVVERAEGFAICEFPISNIARVIAKFHRVKVDGKKLIVAESISWQEDRHLP